MNIGDKRDIDQNDKRQNDDHDQDQTGDGRCSIAPFAQINDIRPVAAAGDRDVAFGPEGQAAVEVNEDHGNQQQGDRVGSGQILVGGEGADGLAVDFGGEHFDARVQSDDGRGFKTFEGT